MKTSVCLILFFLVVNIHVSSQEMKVKYGKILPEHLEMKVYPADTEAVAVVLSKVGRVEYDFINQKLREQRHVAIKLLKETGIEEYGNAVIDYYSHKNYSYVSDIKGQVHFPDATQIKVDNSQIFDIKENDYWSSKKIAFPQLVPGAIIEYQYSITSEGMFHPVDWSFQQSIPIIYTELTTKIPDWFEYVILTQGLPLDKKDTKVIMETIRGQVNVTNIENTFINKDVPALKEECCITTMDDYYSRVRYQLQAVKFPGNSREPVMHTWQEVAKELHELFEWGGQLRTKGPGESVLAAAGIDGLSSSDQMKIVEQLYDYINNNIQWNRFYGIGAGKTISEIIKEKSCSSGDLNKMMCAALIQAGISAKPVLLSTRDNGRPLELYPFTDQFNHLVVLANINEKELWIDLGDKNRPLGTLRPSALNSRAWLVDKENPQWIDVTPKEGKTVFLVKGKLDQDGNLVADLESRFTGYHAIDQRAKAYNEKEKFGDDLIMCGANKVKLSELILINTDDFLLPFQIKAKIENLNIATVTPDKIYLNPIFPEGFDEIPFKLEERTYPIEMNYPEDISIIVDLVIPEGYIVESLPSPAKFITPNNGIQVSYNATQIAGKLNITMKYVVKQLQFDPLEYDILKGIYNERHKKFNEIIVLTKA